MATKLVYSTIVAALGGFGPRAQFFALQDRDVATAARALALEDPGIRVVSAPPATALAGRGMGGVLDGILGGSGGLLSFIPETIKAIPALEAASGMKSAQQIEALPLQEQEVAAREHVAVAQSSAAAVGYAAAGVVGLGIVVSVALALSSRRSRR